MTVPDQSDRANPLGTALDTFRGALVTFAAEVAGHDKALAATALQRVRQAVEAILSEPRYAGTSASASSYDIGLCGALHHQVNMILDEAQAAITTEQDSV